MIFESAAVDERLVGVIDDALQRSPQDASRVAEAVWEWLSEGDPA